MTHALLTFAHISDTHMLDDPSARREGFPDAYANARALVAHINALPYPVDFVLHTGDVGNDPAGPAGYDQIRAVLSQLTAPLYVVAGNHDRVEWLHAAFGHSVQPPYYAFTVKSVTVICLRSNVPNAGHGLLGEAQLAWLDEQLVTAEGAVIVALHHHPFPIGGAPMDALMLTDGDALHAALLKHREKVACVLFGHIHENVTAARDGITYATATSAWYQLKTWPGISEFTTDPVQMPSFNIVTLMSDGTALIRTVRLPMEGA